FPNSFGASLIIGQPHTADPTVGTILEAAAAGKIKTMFVIGGGLLERYGADTLREKLRNVETLVAIQTHRSVLTEMATVALPMTSFAEMDGSICNFEGRVQRYYQAIPPLGQARPLLDTLADLANRWELKTAPRQPENCFAELAHNVEYFAGLSYEMLGDGGVNPSRRSATAATA
ncbi:MAG TPA: molybdopterin-dependent oxidoreductase, partial [Anaerolineae bacterium]